MRGHGDRYRQIAEILARHSLGFLLAVSGLDRRFPALGLRAGSQDGQRRHTDPEHLRLALEELGPTFIKLGQILSTRPELLPPQYIEELAKLQDSAPQVPGDVVRELLADELGRPPEEVFAFFDLTPLASASIGQAHAARLDDGTEVVVKVRRPGVLEQIEQDLEIMQTLAKRADRAWRMAADYDLPGIVAEFAENLRAELDYVREGRNAERFARNFEDEPDLHIPKVFWETSTARVLTLERIRGISVNDVAALRAAGVQPRRIAERAAELAAEMVFEDGFFHADPHPGNLFIEADQRIGLIDFGMVGELDDELRDRLAIVLLALVRQDPRRLATALLRLAVVPRSPDPTALAADLVPVIELYRGRSIGEVSVGRLTLEVLTVLRRHRLRLPPQVALLVKMVTTVEGIGVQLDPDFQLGAVLGPYARRLAAQRLSVRSLMRRVTGARAELIDVVADLPEQMRRVREILDSGGLDVHLRAEELEPLVGRMERVGQRLVVAVIASALVRGIGQLIAANPSRWHSWQGPLMGAGMGMLATMSTYLAWTARRRRGR
ncbi:AarF/ABC1/UbiB kinase family protein [Naasia sp. SYSU D00948]|uniref:ABC1 kinase family protein n=1 Tax=Naasia sp. SYSU D00948 TaxID=2817379 RepID=UPI001B30FB9E|nr:AarF/ABC1/UbiB kinase family protein [Naasia sp. SYSU D00948]